MSATDWHVLGAGAMGCLFADKLHSAGATPVLVMRESYKSTTVRTSVERDGERSDKVLPVSFPACKGYVSHLLVTTKAQDVASSIASISHRLDQASQILIMSNGMGIKEEVQEILPRTACFFGTTTEGAYRIAEHHIRHAGCGTTRIGRTQTESPPAWFKHWAKAVHPSIWDPDIDKALWLKLAINCAINPLTALHRCANGELASLPLRSEVSTLCQEIMAVSAAAGLAQVTRDLPAQVDEVIRATAKNRSSMLQDTLAGRPTEIHYITGYLLRVAKAHGIAIEHNARLYKQIAGRDD